jgi:hypothetical protein
MRGVPLVQETLAVAVIRSTPAHPVFPPISAAGHFFSSGVTRFAFSYKEIATKLIIITKLITLHDVVGFENIFYVNLHIDKLFKK